MPPLRRIGADRSGVTSLEYALIATFVFLAIIGAVTALGKALVGPLLTIATVLANA